MAARVNSFDFISRIYDTLAYVVFGDTIRMSQVTYLNELAYSKRILILGGGTGWLLLEVLKANAAGNITYIEASEKMLSRSKAHCSEYDRGRVEYIHGTEELLTEYGIFDAVVANFYFDLFTDASLRRVAQKIAFASADGALLLATDFRKPRSAAHRILLRTMYFFFKVVANIEASALPDWSRFICNYGFTEAKASWFYNDFISSIVFRKNEAK